MVMIGYGQETRDHALAAAADIIHHSERRPMTGAAAPAAIFT
jgi:hypothetical protein